MSSARFPSLTDQLESYKVVIFITLLMGNVIWLSYNGALISGLLAPKVTKPFVDIESLLTSNYRCVQPQKRSIEGYAENLLLGLKNCQVQKVYVFLLIKLIFNQYDLPMK